MDIRVMRYKKDGLRVAKFGDPMNFTFTPKCKRDYCALRLSYLLNVRRWARWRKTYRTKQDRMMGNWREVLYRVWG